LTNHQEGDIMLYVVYYFHYPDHPINILELVHIKDWYSPMRQLG